MGRRNFKAKTQSIWRDFKFEENPENKIVFDQLREDFKIFRKKFSPLLKRWEISNLEIVDFSRNFQEIFKLLIIAGILANLGLFEDERGL